MNEQERKLRNMMRFRWHEMVLADPKLHHFGSALKVAGLALHRYDIAKNYAEFSLNGAAERLSMDKRTVVRGRNVLVKRGWLRVEHRPMGARLVGPPSITLLGAVLNTFCSKWAKGLTQTPPIELDNRDNR